MLGLALCAVVLGLVALLSLAVGSRSIPLGTAISAFTSYDPADQEELIVHAVRGPRTLIGVMVGAALGLAGALIQGVTRNPLGDPGILGVTAGAALAAAAGVLLLGVESLYGYVWFAFVGAAIGCVAVYGSHRWGETGRPP